MIPGLHEPGLPIFTPQDCTNNNRARFIRPPSGATRTIIGGLQPRSGRMGLESEVPDSAICEQTSCMSKRPLTSLFLSYGSRADLHKHLPFAHKLPVYAHLLVQRALVMGNCNQEAKEPRASSPDLTCEGKNSCTDGNWMDFLVTEGPGLRSGAHLRIRQLPKGEMFRTIGDTEAATVLGLMVVVRSLSISSSLTV